MEADGTHTSLARRSNGATRAGGTAGGLTKLVEQVATAAGTPSTLNLPAANRTQDGRIIRLSMAEQRVVIAKDAGFVNSFLLHGQPHKLLLVSTGNTSTSELTGVVPAISAATHEAICASFLFGTDA